MQDNPASALMNTISELESRLAAMQRRIAALEEERGALYDQNQAMKRDLDDFRERVQSLIARIEDLENRQSSSRLF